MCAVDAGSGSSSEGDSWMAALTGSSAGWDLHRQDSDRQ